MNQTVFIDKLSEKILDKLPKEALEKITKLSSAGSDSNAEIQKTIEENHIDYIEIAKNMIEEEK